MYSFYCSIIVLQMNIFMLSGKWLSVSLVISLSRFLEVELFEERLWKRTFLRLMIKIDPRSHAHLHSREQDVLWRVHTSYHFHELWDYCFALFLSLN